MQHLCHAVRLEVAAWQQRIPEAEQLMDASMTPRHVLMLLALMQAAEGSISGDSTVQRSSFVSRQLCSQAAAASAANGQAGAADAPVCALEVLVSAQDVERTLLHYGLLRRDGFADVFLRNAAVNNAGSETLRAATKNSCSGPGDSAGAASQNNSLAALLVWVSRCAATASFLERVLSIARRECELAQQVGWRACVPSACISV